MGDVTNVALSTFLKQKELQKISPDIVKKIESHFETAAKDIRKYILLYAIVSLMHFNLNET